MKTILVTGSEGFIGRNLCVALRRHDDYRIIEFSRRQALDKLPGLVSAADMVFHLAGVNRPLETQDFVTGNTGLTRRLGEALAATGRKIPLVFSSSIQAEMDNPYGRSKRLAEDAVLDYHKRTGSPVYVYRFPNVFGKWSRPNYNTVVATFCHQISRGLPVQISNRENQLRLIYIDDVVRICREIAARAEHDPTTTQYEAHPQFFITLGQLHDLLISFREARTNSLVPDLSQPLTKYLYATYVSFFDAGELAQPVQLKTDDRGWLFELVKSPQAGQVFVSRTKPGITRGNHYHHTKTEKFCVIGGEGIIRLRSLQTDAIVEYHVNDREIRIVDIPPGYVHSIENNGSGEMITLFWANEIFDPERPDTCYETVVPPAASQ